MHSVNGVALVSNSTNVLDQLIWAATESSKREIIHVNMRPNEFPYVVFSPTWFISSVALKKTISTDFTSVSDDDEYRLLWNVDQVAWIFGNSIDFQNVWVFILAFETFNKSTLVSSIDWHTNTLFTLWTNLIIVYVLTVSNGLNKLDLRWMKTKKTLARYLALSIRRQRVEMWTISFKCKTVSNDLASTQSVFPRFLTLFLSLSHPVSISMQIIWIEKWSKRNKIRIEDNIQSKYCISFKWDDSCQILSSEPSET